MALLQQISMNELNKEPMSKATKKKVHDFFRQCERDSDQLPKPAAGFDPLFAAEMILESLYGVAKVANKQGFDDESLAKIDRISELFPDDANRGQIGVYVYNLYQAIETVARNTLDEMHQKIVTNGINRHLDVIKSALNKNKLDVTTQAFLDFGVFLQERFPGLGAEEIRDKIGSTIDQFVQKELPNLNLFSALYEARIILNTQAVTDEDESAIYKCDALARGINLFGAFIEDRPLDFAQEAEVEAACNEVIKSSYQVPSVITDNVKKELIAQQLIFELSEHHKQCLAYLSDVIKKETQQLTGSKAEIDVNKFAEDLQHHRPAFGREEAFENVSDELRVAANTYLAIKQLDNVLYQRAKFQDTLEKYKQKFEDPEIKNALSSNPDGHVKSFFKKAAYILATVVTFGIVHAVTEGKPLMSEQQQLAKKLMKGIRAAEEQDIIKPSAKPG